MGRKPPKPQDFEKFFYTKVGLGEGCGCAERVIDMHEFDRSAGQPKRQVSLLLKKESWRRFLNKAGLTQRPRMPPTG